MAAAVMVSATALATVASPAEAVDYTLQTCDDDLVKTTATSIRYWSCKGLIDYPSYRTFGASGQIVNDHGSAVTVQYQLGYRRGSSTTTTWFSTVYTKKLPGRGPYAVATKEVLCPPGLSFRGVLRVKVGSTWGPSAVSRSQSC